MTVKFYFDHTMLDPDPLEFTIDNFYGRPMVGDRIDWSMISHYLGKRAEVLGEASWVISSCTWSRDKHEPRLYCGIDSL